MRQRSCNYLKIMWSEIYRINKELWHRTKNVFFRIKSLTSIYVRQLLALQAIKANNIFFKMIFLWLSFEEDVS